MADNLVVRDWYRYGDMTVRAINAYHLPLDALEVVHEHNALARAYLERDAQLASVGTALAVTEVQLAAMTAEREAEREALAHSRRERNQLVGDLQAQLAAMTEERDALRAEWHRAEEVSGEYQAKLTASEAHSENLAWSLLYAMAERDDALWMLGRIDKGIRGCGGNWYQAVCYASAMCERALAGSKRIKEDE